MVHSFKGKEYRVIENFVPFTPGQSIRNIRHCVSSSLDCARANL